MGLKVDTIQNPSSSTVNLTLDASGNVTAGNNFSVGTATTTAGYQSEIKSATGVGASLLLTATDATGNAQAVFKGSRQFKVGTGNASSGFANTFYVYDATAASTRISMDANGIVTGTAGNLMLVQGTSQASTSGTAISFNNVIPSWAKRVIVSLNNVSVTTGGTAANGLLAVQLGTGTTPTWVTSGYAGGCDHRGGGTQATNCFLFMFSSAAITTYVNNGQMILTLNNGNTWTETCNSYSTTAGNIGCYGSGSVSLGAALTSLRVTTVGGTDVFTAGNINIQWE